MTQPATQPAAVPGKEGVTPAAANHRSVIPTEESSDFVIPAGGIPALLPHLPGSPPTTPAGAGRRDDEDSGAKTAALPAELPVRRGVEPKPTTTGWTLETFAGRMVEFSAGRSGGALTLALGLLREAQLSGEPTAWIARPEGSFFPPDAVIAGVDLAALPVIEPRKPLDALKAADRLLRSGAFGLIAVDLSPGVQIPIAAQTRLAGLAKKHGTALICLTEKEITQPSLGSLVSLRAQIDRQEIQRQAARRTGTPDATRASSVRQIGASLRDDVPSTHGGRWLCRARVIKDKQRGPGWEHVESFSGPPGLP